MKNKTRALATVHMINELEAEIKRFDEVLRLLDLITRRSPKSKIFTRKGKIYASPRYGDSTLEVELHATDLMMLETALEKERDRTQEDLNKLLEGVGT